MKDVNSITYRTVSDKKTEDRSVVVFKGQAFYTSTGTSPSMMGILDPSWRERVWMPFEIVESKGKLMKSGEKADTTDLESFIAKSITEMLTSGDINEHYLQSLIAKKYKDSQYHMSRQDLVVEIKTELGRFGTVEYLMSSLEISSVDENSLVGKLQKHLKIQPYKLNLNNVTTHTVNRVTNNFKAVGEINSWLEKEKEIQRKSRTLLWSSTSRVNKTDNLKIRDLSHSEIETLISGALSSSL